MFSLNLNFKSNPSSANSQPTLVNQEKARVIVMSPEEARGYADKSFLDKMKNLGKIISGSTLLEKE